jgi:hypothetical protein
MQQGRQFGRFAPGMVMESQEHNEHSGFSPGALCLCGELPWSGLR